MCHRDVGGYLGLLIVSRHAQTPDYTPQQRLTLLCFWITAVAVVLDGEAIQQRLDFSSTGVGVSINPGTL
jgi:hypothetical protein